MISEEKVTNMLRALAVSVAAGILSLGGSPPAQAAITCLPETPVCQEVRGVPGDRFYWFEIQPAPATAVFTFIVNDVLTPGSLTTSTSGTALEGDFRPAVVLVSGDEVCMRVSTLSGEFCATTP
ncbi:hypothetical protein ACWDRB_09145 [Nonomuraea sp. NPDC003707]